MFNLFIFRCGENLFHFARLFVYYFSDHEGLPWTLYWHSKVAFLKNLDLVQWHTTLAILDWWKSSKIKSPLQTIFYRSMYYGFRLILCRFRTYAILLCVQRGQDFIKLHEVSTFFSRKFCRILSPKARQTIRFVEKEIKNPPRSLRNERRGRKEHQKKISCCWNDTIKYCRRIRYSHWNIQCYINNKWLVLCWRISAEFALVYSLEGSGAWMLFERLFLAIFLDF